MRPFAADHAVFIKNRLPSKSNGFASSYARYYGQEDDLSRVKVFGCDCYAYADEECIDSKLGPMARKLTYVGNVPNSTTYIRWWTSL